MFLSQKKDPPESGNYDDPDLNLMFFFNILVKTFKTCNLRKIQDFYTRSLVHSLRKLVLITFEEVVSLGWSPLYDDVGRFFYGII